MPPLAVEISSRRVGGLLMAIANHGWEFNVRRLGLHKRGPQVRTYGTYEVFIDGVSAATTNPLLKGNVCEVTGPGKNHPQNNGLRIEAGRYQLTTQFGQRYESIGYSTDTQVAAKLLMPGIGLVNTGQRIGILIHPGLRLQRRLFQSNADADGARRYRILRIPIARYRPDRQPCRLRAGGVSQLTRQANQKQHNNSRSFRQCRWRADERYQHADTRFVKPISARTPVATAAPA
jgi:hypothetical protein